MNFKDIFLSNQIYAFLGKGIEGIKIISINVIVARFYGPELFGKFAFVIAVISIVAVIAEFRLQGVLIREYSKKNIELPVLLGSSLVLNIFFAIIGFALVYWYTYIESDPVVALGVLIYGLSFFYKIPRLLRGFFISIEKNIFIAKCEIISSLITAFVLFFIVYNQYSIEYVLLGRSFDFFIVSILFIVFFYAYGERLSNIKVDLGVVKYLFFRSAPLVLSGAAMILFQRVDVILVRNFLGDYQAGLYGSAANIMILFSLIPLVLSESLAPRIFKEIDSKKSKELRFKFSYILISIGLLLSLAMSVLSYPLIYILYGEKYLVTWNVLLILSLSPLLISLGSVAGQLIVADNTQNWAYVKSIVGCAITIILNLVLIPILGIEGAALSTLAGLFIANFAAHYFIPIYRGIFYIQCQSFNAFFINLYKTIKS